MQKRANIIVAVFIIAYIALLSATLYKTHQQEQVRRCFEQYGEGDLGMCMCTEQCD